MNLVLDGGGREVEAWSAVVRADWGRGEGGVLPDDEGVGAVWLLPGWSMGGAGGGTGKSVIQEKS